MREFGPWLVVTALLLALCGCAPLDPAPEDLDGLFHYIWSHLDEGADEELAGAAVNAHAAVDGGTLAEPLDGTVTDLDRAALETVGMPASADPAAAVGLYRVGWLPCSLDQVERAAISDELVELYPDLIDDSERTYLSDLAAYQSREAATLDWESRIEDSLAGTAYSKRVLGGIRRIPVLDDVASPWGPVLVTRAWLPEPAVFDGDDYYWDQDYQVDLYLERAPGEVLHLLALWRSVGMGTITSDNEFMQTMILKARADWDERTAELCEAGEI
jgi:hypothetical protein